MHAFHASETRLVDFKQVYLKMTGQQLSWFGRRRLGTTKMLQMFLWFSALISI